MTEQHEQLAYTHSKYKPMNDQSKYALTLENGETREVYILGRKKFCAVTNRDASHKYLTLDEIKEAGDKIVSVDYAVEYTLFEQSAGYIIDEGSMFATYKALRNPIKSLDTVKS